MKLWLIVVLQAATILAAATDTDRGNATDRDRECSTHIGEEIEFTEEDKKNQIKTRTIYKKFYECRANCLKNPDCLSYQMTDQSKQVGGKLSEKYYCLQHTVDITAGGGFTDGTNRRVYGTCTPTTKACTTHLGKVGRKIYNSAEKSASFINVRKRPPLSSHIRIYKNDSACRNSCMEMPDCLSYQIYNATRSRYGRYFCSRYSIDLVAEGTRVADNERLSVGTCKFGEDRECTTSIGLGYTGNEKKSAIIAKKTYKTFDECRKSCYKDYKCRGYEMTDTSSSENGSFVRPYTCTTYSVDITSTGLTDAKTTSVYGACKKLCPPAERECTTEKGMKINGYKVNPWDREGNIENAWENLIKTNPYRYPNFTDCLNSCKEDPYCKSYRMKRSHFDRELRYRCNIYKSDVLENGTVNAIPSWYDANATSGWIWDMSYIGSCTCKEE